MTVIHPTGIPDFTPDEGEACDVIAPDRSGHCTQPLDHTGWHAAGTGLHIIAMWDDEPIETPQ